MNRDRLRRWVEVFDRMEARPGDPVTCPDCGEGTLVARDIRVQEAADPDVGIRLIRCTRCGHRGDARVRFARPASAPGACPGA